MVKHHIASVIVAMNHSKILTIKGQMITKPTNQFRCPRDLLFTKIQSLLINSRT